jgi:hypothetical protein
MWRRLGSITCTDSRRCCPGGLKSPPHPKRAAVAFVVTAETMMKYYTATEKKATADEVLGGGRGRRVGSVAWVLLRVSWRSGPTLTEITGFP